MQWPDDIEDVGYALHLIPSVIPRTALANVSFVYLHFVSSFATNVCERDWVELFDALPKLRDLGISLSLCPNGNPDVGLPQAFVSAPTVEPQFRSLQLRHFELTGFRVEDKIDSYVKCFATRRETAPLSVLLLSNCTPIMPHELQLLEKYVKMYV